MESRNPWLGMTVPRGWDDVLFRAVVAGVGAFVALMLKEWLDGGLDAPGCAVDAAWVAGGVLVLNAILRLAKS